MAFCRVKPNRSGVESDPLSPVLSPFDFTSNGPACTTLVRNKIGGYLFPGNTKKLKELSYMGAWVVFFCQIETDIVMKSIESVAISV